MAFLKKPKFVCRPQSFVSAFSSLSHGIPHHFGDYVFKGTFSHLAKIWHSKFLTTSTRWNPFGAWGFEWIPNSEHPKMESFFPKGNKIGPTSKQIKWTKHLRKG